MRFAFFQIVLSTIILLFASCEKDLNMTLVESEKQVVVEGVIEKGELPYVILTNSIGFFDKIDFNSVKYLRNANITVTDITTGISQNLREYSLDTLVGGQRFSFGVYAPDFTNPASNLIKGQLNHLYRLVIQFEGKQYESITKIPESTGLDSLRLEPVPGKETQFSIIKAMYKDPDTLGNCVRLETRRQKMQKDSTAEVFLTSFGATYDDNIINGLRVPITISMGFDRNRNYTNEEFQNIGYVMKGDTVTVKWSAIDKQVYRFWETLAFAAGSVGNPFAAPTKIQSNISNGALGVWAGYGSYYYTIIDSLK